MPTMNCPECGDSFDTDRAAKIHCKLSHGFSLSKTKTICEIDGCEQQFKYYPSEKSGVICPDCIEENGITLCRSCHAKVEHGKKDIPTSVREEKGLVESDPLFDRKI